MQGRGPLQVQRSVIFRREVLAIRLLSHFDIRNWITPFLEIGDLRSGVFRCPIQHRHGYHRREAPRQSAGVEQIKADLITGFHAIGDYIKVGGLMPGINR